MSRGTNTGVQRRRVRNAAQLDGWWAARCWPFFCCSSFLSRALAAFWLVRPASYILSGSGYALLLGLASSFGASLALLLLSFFLLLLWLLFRLRRRGGWRRASARRRAPDVQRRQPLTPAPWGIRTERGGGRGHHHTRRRQHPPPAGHGDRFRAILRFRPLVTAGDDGCIAPCKKSTFLYRFSPRRRLPDLGPGLLLLPRPS